MQNEWLKITDDPNERKVLEALADPAWDFRTIDGLVRATGLPKSKVRQIVTKYMSQDIIRQSPIPDKQGRELFTLSTKKSTLGEFLNIIRSSVTKTTSG